MGFTPAGGGSFDPDQYANGQLVPYWGLEQPTSQLLQNRTFGARFLAGRSLNITKMGFLLASAATANDNVDVGIFSGDGQTLLGSAGSTGSILNGSLGIKNLPLTAPVQLVAGKVYYTALACGPIGGTAASIAIFGAISSSLAQFFGNTFGLTSMFAVAGAFPLATPITSGGSASAPVLSLLTS